MSFDLMVFEPNDAPRERSAFLDWYRAQMKWPEGHRYDDPSVSSTKLASWYAEMCTVFADMSNMDPSDDCEGTAGYSIGKSMIYVDFSWSDVDEAYEAVRSLAIKHRVGFFDVSSANGEILFPSTNWLTSRVFGTIRTWWKRSR